MGEATGRGSLDLRIEPESDADTAAIDAVTAAAFLDAAHSRHTEQAIVRDLRAASALTVSLVARVGATLVGHAAASPVTIANGPAGWFGLGPVSVAPGWQHRGIGTALIRRVLDDLRGRGAAGCVVLGEPAFYGRFGFHAVPGLSLPGVPPEYFQAVNFAGVPPSGIVRYHPAFDQDALDHG